MYCALQKKKCSKKHDMLLGNLFLNIAVEELKLKPSLTYHGDHESNFYMLSVDIIFIFGLLLDGKIPTPFF
jgi:hypothetical protein